MGDFYIAEAVRTSGDDVLAVEVVNEKGKTLSSTRSFNNRLILEAYKKGSLQSSVSNGFAFVEQKVSVKGLTVLMDTKLADGTVILKGSTAYIREEALYTQQWAQKILESDTLGVPFIIADIASVEFITPPGETAA